MTIGEYLKNPYGKGSAFSPSAKQREDLEKQLLELSEKILSKIYRYRDFVIFHVVIPSTKKDDVTYDVVIEVETKRLHEGAATLEDLPFKIFSNCPSFIFTYAHVFRSNGMLCDWLLPKYNKEVRTKPPTQRNQYGIVGLERSMYLALRHLHMSGKTRVGVYQTAGEKVTSRIKIINSVRSQQQIMDKVRAKQKPGQENTTVAGKDDPAFGSKSVTPHRAAKSKITRKTLFTKPVKDVKTGDLSKRQRTIKKTKTI